MENEVTLQARYEVLFQHLDERQRRLVAAADAEQLGHGGVSIVARTSGLSRPTIHKGLRELREEPLAAGRSRRAGGGRKGIEEAIPSVLERLEELIDPVTRGDPMSPLRWTAKSTRHLAQALSRGGHAVSHETVAQLLKVLGYSLQGTPLQEFWWAMVACLARGPVSDRGAVMTGLPRQFCSREGCHSIVAAASL